jgi:DNA-binding NarL/FixJ family response regulator
MYHDLALPRHRPIEQASESAYPANVTTRENPSLALIDPKALSRGLIGELLARTLPEHRLVTVSTGEELLANATIERPSLVVVYIRSAKLTNPWVQSTLELLRVRGPAARVVVLSDKDDAEVRLFK